MRNISTHSSLKSLLTLILLIAMSMGTTVYSQEVASDEYLTGYMLLQDGKSLEQNNDVEAAFRKYQAASDIFDSVASKYPNWETRMVKYRRTKIREDLARIYDLLPANSSLRRRESGSGSVKNYSPSTNSRTFGARGDASEQAAQHKEEIARIASERDNAIRELNSQSMELEGLRDDLKASDDARMGIAERLRVTQDALRQKGEDPANSKDVAKLKKELEIANDTVVANDQRFKAIKDAHDKALTEIAELKRQRDEVTREYAELTALLNKSENGDLKKLIAENQSLKKQLEETNAEVARLKGENSAKDQEIASLNGQIKGVEMQLASIKAENAEYRSRIEGLTTKLKDTQKELAATESKSRDSINAEMQKENTILQGIIVRQLKQQARRQRAKQLVLAELSKLEIQSDSLTANVDRLSGNFSLSDEEREILEGPIYKDSVDEAGGFGSTIFMKAGDGSAAEYPEIDNNEGDKNSYGLSADMMKFAKAAAYDFGQGNLGQSEAAYQQIVDIVPDNVYTLRNLGIVKTHLDKIDEAKKLFDKAIAYNPSDDYSHFIKGYFHYRQKDMAAALTSFQEAIKLNPKNAKAHNYLGAISMKNGLRDQAIAAYRSVIESNPGFADAHFNLAYLLLDSDPKAAFSHYKRYLMNDGKEDPAMNQKFGN
jgi:Tfp pilus assembly protein PilF